MPRLKSAVRHENMKIPEAADNRILRFRHRGFHKWPALVAVTFLTVFIRNADSACTFPATLLGTFVSTPSADVTSVFTETTVVGFDFTDFGNQARRLTYDCDEYDSTTSTYLIKSQSSIFTLNENWNVYGCLTMTQSSATVGDLFYYYKTIDSPIADTPVQTIRVAQAITLSIACNKTTAETVPHLLAKQSTITTSKINCPNLILGRYSYTVDGNCGATSSMDSCTDTTVATVNNSLGCANDISYSDSGDMHCAATFEMSGMTYVYTINPQTTVDDTNTFRFACFVLKQNADGQKVDGTVTKSVCAATQTHAANGDYVLQFTPSFVCPILPTTTTTTTTASTTTTTPGANKDTTLANKDTTKAAANQSPDSSGSSMIPIIAGAAAGGALLILGGVAAGVIISKKKKQKKVAPKKFSGDVTHGTSTPGVDGLAPVQG